MRESLTEGRSDGPPHATRIGLTIAGSDSGGGAGIQADLKTFHQFGVFGTSVVVAVTAQNTLCVSDVHPIPAEVVQAQMAALAGDLPPHAVKTGMLATAEIVETVAGGIHEFGFPQVVVDPVMVATSGDRLLSRDAEQSIVDRLIPLALLVTPNRHEASILAQQPVDDVEGMERAGCMLVERGAKAALIKGGHMNATRIVDVLVTGDDVQHYTHPRIDTKSTHGTGCTLSSAVTASLALGADVPTAVARGLDFVHRAIEDAPGLGEGHGPLNHFVSPGSR